MTKFFVIYHAPSEAVEAQMAMAPEVAAKAMEGWMKWAEQCGDALVDFGSPLGGGQRVTKSGSQDSTQQVTGYSILEADNIGAAKELLESHPHLEWATGCEIEVHECFPPPGASE